MLFPSVLVVFLVGAVVAAYYPVEDYYIPAARQIAPSRTYEVGRAYFGNFELDDFNPFNWGKEKHERSAEDMKFEGLYRIAECLSKSGADCDQLLQEVKPRIFGKPPKENKKPAETTSAPPPSTSTAPLSSSSQVPQEISTSKV